MPNRIALLERFSDPSPALRVKFFNEPQEKPLTVKVTHELRPPPGAEGRQYLKTLGRHPAMRELIRFYKEHDGFELCTVKDSRYEVPDLAPLLNLKPAGSIAKFTSRYQPGGDRAGTIDYNKSRNLYRNSDSWIAFAEINRGPLCLTTFLEGDNAGKVFYVAPEPPFNNLRPIAGGFRSLLDRIDKDLAAFFRLVRARIGIRCPDGQNYGFWPSEYVPGSKSRAKRPRRKLGGN